MNEQAIWSIIWLGMTIINLIALVVTSKDMFYIGTLLSILGIMLAKLLPTEEKK